MIISSKEDFKKIANLMETAFVVEGNYWVITRSGKEYTLHVDTVVNDLVIARITKVQQMKGLIKGYRKKADLERELEVIYLTIKNRDRWDSVLSAKTNYSLLQDRFEKLEKDIKNILSNL